MLRESRSDAVVLQMYGKDSGVDVSISIVRNVELLYVQGDSTCTYR